jgi:hypothetical protein
VIADRVILAVIALRVILKVIPAKTAHKVTVLMVTDRSVHNDRSARSVHKATVRKATARKANVRKANVLTVIAHRVILEVIAAMANVLTVIAHRVILEVIVAAATVPTVIVRRVIQAVILAKTAHTATVQEATDPTVIVRRVIVRRVIQAVILEVIVRRVIALRVIALKVILPVIAARVILTVIARVIPKISRISSRIRRMCWVSTAVMQNIDAVERASGVRAAVDVLRGRSADSAMVRRRVELKASAVAFAVISMPRREMSSPDAVRSTHQRCSSTKRISIRTSRQNARCAVVVNVLQMINHRSS